MTDELFNLGQPMSLSTALAIYEGQRPYMPQPRSGLGINAPNLRSILDKADALLLDGYGVLNVGAEAVTDANAMLQAAKMAGVEVMVLTNGASKDSVITAQKYQGLGLDINPDHVVSSRDAMMEMITENPHGITSIGVADSFTDVPVAAGIEMVSLSDGNADADKWLSVDAIGLFGAVHWSEAWQSKLEAAVAAGKPIYVANPDVTAPQTGAYSREPGFWVAKACRNMDAAAMGAQVYWFGKPHAPVFDLALRRLSAVTGRTDWDKSRIFMVGDTLHTDILGGSAAGLSTVLIKNHGLFRDGGAEDAIAISGITPDYVVDTV